MTQRNSLRAAIVALVGTFRLGELCGTDHNKNVIPTRSQFTRPENDVRMIEYVCKTDTWFDGQEKLLHRNVAMPKLCPVKAIDSCILESHTNRSGSKPFFCNDDGSALTVKSVMFELHWSMKLAGISTIGFTSKCFRRGSVRNALANGASEEQIKQSGPWKSKAWKHYS